MTAIASSPTANPNSSIASLVMDEVINAVADVDSDMTCRLSPLYTDDFSHYLIPRAELHSEAS
jgi:hypothetical protein